MSEYTPTKRSRVQRKHDRGRYDRETVHGILDAAVICHVAYVIDGQPYCTPTAFWREGDTLYWHGSSASRMLRHEAQGTPVCLTVTHFDGLVLARSGFHSSMNYRSVMAFGQAHIVTDPQHKREALDAYVERLFPGRVPEARAPTDNEVKATTVIAMEIEEASAKMRHAPPGDDEEDYALPIWAGVVPFHTVVGPLEPCPRLADGTPPSTSVDAYREGAELPEVLTRLAQKG